MFLPGPTIKVGLFSSREYLQVYYPANFRRSHFLEYRSYHPEKVTNSIHPFHPHPSIEFILKSNVAFITGMFLIGSFFVINKQIIAEIPIFIASEIRLLMGAIILFGLARLKGNSTHKFDQHDIRILFTQAFFGIFLFSIFSLNGLKNTSAMNSGIIMGMTPVAILILAVVLHKESISKHAIFATILACIGVIVINTTNRQNTIASSLSGDALVFLAMLGEAVFIVSGRLIKSNPGPLLMSAFTAAFGALMFLPLTIYSMGHVAWAQISLSTWLAVAYTGVGITAAGVFLMNLGSANMPMSRAASLSAFMPVSSCLLVVIFLDETFRMTHLIGLSLILISALIALRQTNLKSTRDTVNKKD